MMCPGFSAAIAVPGASTFIGVYFEKRRGLACGIMLSGSSFGVLVLSPVLTWFSTLFSSRGALMIVAGLWLNMLVVATICMPIELDTSISIDVQLQQSNHDYSSTSRGCSLEQLKEKFATISMHDMKSIRTVSELCTAHANSVTGNASKEAQARYLDEIYSPKSIDIHAGEPYKFQVEANRSTVGRFNVPAFLKQVREYFRFLFKPRFFVTVIVSIIAIFAHMNTFFLIPLLCKELNFGKRFASQIIMVSAIGELVSRPLVGLIADKLAGRKVLIIQLGSIITCAAGVFVFLSMTRVSFLVYGCILGVFGGIHMPLLLPMMLECTSKSHHSSVAGLAHSLTAFSGTIGIPLLSKYAFQHVDMYNNV